jgi:hypothetical protein
MRKISRPSITEVSISIGGLAIALGAIVSVDERVRQRFVQAFNQTSGEGVGSWIGELQAIAGVVATAARDQSLEHAPLLVFVAVALVLLACMLRT